MKKTKNKKVVETKKPHVTRGSVFDDLNFSPEEAAILKLKADLHAEIISIVEARKLSPRNLEQTLEQPQPRISELLRGKISKVSAEKLVGYLSKLRVPVEISTGNKNRRTRPYPLPVVFHPQVNIFVTINVTTQTTSDVGNPIEQITNAGSVNDDVINMNDFRKRKAVV